MGDLNNKILGVYQKIEGQLANKQDKLTSEQLSGINLAAGHETRISNIESLLNGLEQTLHQINTGASS